ncbi:MAG: DUF6174 domain-containing protein [Spirochaetaceae bacterium]|nr:DUF6174 domain-containing protein [Spirochaetaceae bacterium]
MYFFLDGYIKELYATPGWRKRMKAMIRCGIIVSLMVSSCIGLFDNGFDEALFRKERAAWEAQGLRHYRFVTTYSSDAFGSRPSVEITVFPDKEPEVVVQREDSGIEEPYYGKTIDEVYQYIADEMSNIRANYSIRIRYHEGYHYPELYSISPGGDVDGGWGGFTITEFEVLGE